MAEQNIKEELEDLLLDMVDRLVSAPDSVQARCVETQTMIGFELQVLPADFGKVLGSGGETVKAIRHILMCAARLRGVRVNLDLLDPNPHRRRLQHPPQP